jgi:predicted Fe-Mo cluster-binding NifX family protein
MKAAFSAWNHRIAPVFDAAKQLHIVEAESGRIIRETTQVLADDLPAQKLPRLAEWGIDTLVCGAISRPMQVMVKAYGIQVIPFVMGDLYHVIQAWLSDRLEDDLFTMPGCRGRAHRRVRSTRGVAPPKPEQEVIL